VRDAKLTLVQTWDDACDFKRWLGERREFLAVDTETTGLNVGKDKLRLVQFGDTESGWVLPHDDWRGLTKEVLGGGGYQGDIVFWNALF